MESISNKNRNERRVPASLEHLLEFQLEGKYRRAEFVTPIYSSFTEGLFKADYF